jgi:TonB family protein
MKAKSGNNIVELLRKWLTGEARAGEERQLDQSAKDDPFLAEALEGYRNAPEADYARNLTRIKAELRNRYGRNHRRGGVVYLPRIAAAIAVLILAGGGWWLLNRDQNFEKSGTLTQETGDNRERAPAVNIKPAEEEISADTGAPPTASGRPENQAASKPKDQDSEPIALMQEKAPAAQPEKEAGDQIAFEDITTRQPAARSRAAPEEFRVPNKEVQAVPPAPSRDAILEPSPKALDNASTGYSWTITGRVIDSEGNPLIGVNVLLPGTSTGAVTGLDGRFSIRIDQPDRQLVFSYTGFDSKTLPADTAGEMQVALSESSLSLDEVAVTGFSEKKKAKAGAGASSVRPKGGFVKFEEYVSKNISYPAAALENGVKGVVIVEFSVDKNGKLSDFKVVQSLGYGCDEEAVRLLKEGPKWEIVGNLESAKASYGVEF